MREKLLVIIVFEGVCECERIVEPLEAEVVALIAVHKVIYVFTDTMPAHTFRFFDLLRES